MGPEDMDADELLESPNARPVDAGPICFLNAERPCGPACLAFVTHPRLSQNSDLTAEQAHCAIICNSERVGRGVIMAAQALTEVAVSVKSLLNRTKNAEADMARANQFSTSVATQATVSPFGDKKQ